MIDPSAIKSQIQSRNFDKIYVFTGPEWKVQRIYLEQIAKASGKDLRYTNSISDIYSKLNSRSFVAKSYVYVIRDDAEFTQNEKLQDKLETMIKDDIIVFLLTSVDKRTKFYKKYQDRLVEFETLSVEILKKYIQKELSLSDKNAEKLAEICEQDYGRCLLEIDKIKQYMESSRDANDSTYTADHSFQYLLKTNAIYQPPKDAIFDFVDAILDRKRAVFDLYEQCKAVGEATMVMLTVLYNNAKALLQVQSCTGDVAKTTGLTKWQIMGANKHLGNYSNCELIDLMLLCQKCQQDIVTGLIDEAYVIDYILVSVL